MTLKVTLVGGPTVLLDVGGLRIVVDPTFDPPGYFTGSKGQRMEKLRGPAVSIEEASPIDMALVSHDHHVDHVDAAGRELIKKLARVYTTQAGAERLGGTSIGLAEYESTSIDLPSGGHLTLTALPAQHGPDHVCESFGPVIGFLLRGEGVPTTYISGDNSSIEVVSKIQEKVGKVDLALLYAGGPRFDELFDGYLTLSNDAALQVSKLLGDATTVVPIHAEGWAHFTQTPAEMRELFDANGRGDRLLVLRPGESADFA